MLTAKQASAFGYTSVHDLPTPPYTRSSPPGTYQDHPYKRAKSARQQSHSPPPPRQPMSSSHRGLPPPAAMALPPHQQQGPSVSSHAPPHAPPPSHQHHQHVVPQQSNPHQHPPPQPPPGGQGHLNAAQGPSTLPAPPPQWQGSEESMRNWLQARAEEERTKQEEERTRQETLRLEQRKIESDMLRASLSGGIPPPMVPLVFAGMGAGGVLPQAALDWAQQFMNTAQGHHLQIMPPQGQASPRHQRDPSGQSFGPYGSGGPAQAPPHSSATYQTQPGSPSRIRSQTIAGPSAHQSQPMANPPTINTNVASGGLAGGSSTHPPHGQLQGQQSSQESGPGLYFHHWQPPTSQAGGSTSASTNRPGSPPGDITKKRKPGSSTTDQPPRSPPSFTSSHMQPSSNRRGHKRQRSDLSWYRSNTTQEGAEESDRSAKEKSPVRASRERSRSEVGKHSVSSLLSGYPAEQPSETRTHSWQSPSAYYGGGGGSGRGTRPGSPVESDPRSQGHDSQRGKRQ